MTSTNDKDRQFEEMFRDHYDLVYNLCLRMGVPARDVQDLCQEVFLSVYRNLDGFRGESKISTWIYKVTVNRCVDYFRLSNRLSRGLEKLARLWEGNGEKDPGDQVIDRVDGIQVLKKLHPRQRALLVMKVFLGLDYNEMAQVLEVTPQSVGVMLTRARKAARKVCKRKGL